MAAAAMPIRFNELTNLTNLGIQATSFRFGSLTMESDKYICVRETAADNSQQVVIIDCNNGFSVTRRPMKAESAIMNPVSNIIALKAAKADGSTGCVLQIFNLETKTKLKAHQWEQNVVFWRWLSPNKIAMVTGTSVFHWSMEAEEPPVKVFDRAEALANQDTQIIAYTTDANEKWCLLTGISTPDGGRTINGHMQLYSTEKSQQQLLQGHAGCFTNMIVEDGQPAANIFCFAERKADSPTVSRLHLMDVSKVTPFRRVVDIPYPPEAPNDFPVAMQASEKHGVLYMITKMGFLFIFEVSTGALLFRNRISQETVFITARNATNGGIIGVNRKGQVLGISIDENNLIPFIQNQLRHIPDNMGLALKLATRYGFGGADDLFVQNFNRLLAAGDYKGAAAVAGSAPGTVLRNSDTINKFKSLPAQPGQPQPILQYFSTLLEKGKLNAVESVELAKPVLQQGRREFLEKWLKEDKLECSTELGDMVKQFDVNLALSVYLRANAPAKVITCFVEQGQYDKIIAYAKKVNFTPDYVFLLRNIIAVNPDGACNFAKMLASNEGGSLVDTTTVVDIFMQHNRLQETTSFLLDVLKGNKQEDAFLQTRLLEMNLMAAPQVAEAILQMEMFTHYDRIRIGALCEKAGLYQRALEHYTDISDIKRVMLNTHAIQPEFLVNFFGRLPPEQAMECLYEMLKSNRNNLQIVVQTAMKYQEYLTPPALIKMFETFNSYEGLFFFLGAILNFSQDADVHFKYIEAAAKLGHVKEVERVCRESKVYDPIKVKDFLKETKLPDPRPLIYVCDQHGYVDELTQYLYKNNLQKYIEVYVVKVNPSQTPVVIGSLLDLDCSEEFIRNILNNVRGACPVDALVEEVEKRHRLRLVQPWLEARASEGNTEPGLHNALAKIYIDTNKDPESFLINNQYYDSKVVGKYCEDRDPHLAFTAYKRAWGSCDLELVDVTNKNSLFRLQARYLVERQSAELWAHVLQETNAYRRQVIDQVVGTALPETKDADEVSTTVKAFMTAELPNELIELLEKIVLHNSDFSNNRNLQNLLILTAIKADQSRVMDYINRLDNYDGPDIAKIALGEQYKLYEEAFVIYKKFKLNVDAVEVLLNNVENIERAHEFAAKCNEPEVWSKLAKSQLNANLISACIDSYIKANDPSLFADVIQAAEREDCFEDLVKYLQMARKNIKDALIDSELVYSFAKTNRLADLEEFISGPNTANISNVGDRCYDERLFEAAKLLFTNIGNNAKLASCLVNLGQYQAAVDAARKANSPRTWKEVNAACVAAKEFRLAQIAGLHIIIHPDHLEDIISFYENRGYYEELIQLLESGLGLERAHIGMFTELGVLYAKYKPEKLMEHCRMFYQRVNIPKLLRACERHQMWAEAVFLYMHYDEYDNAVNTMMQHSPVCWTHELFGQAIVKVSNSELYYRAIKFYLDEAPLLLNDLLRIITPKVDHTKVVSTMRKFGHLALILPYLKTVQNINLAPVNEAINELYVEQEEYDNLRASIHEFDNFDQIALAQKIEKHELLEFRRIAALLYKGNKRFEQSIELSKKDKLYKDAMETAQESLSQELAEDLIRFFVDIKDKECFAATLFTCYDVVRPDVALELAWRNNFMDFVMPFMIQVLREYTTKVDALDKRLTEVKKKSDAVAAEQASAPVDMHDMGMPPYFNGGMGMGNLALMPPPGSMPGGGYGMPGYQDPMSMGYGGQPGYGMQPGYGQPF
eukprot:GILJ01000776.1.p1 GENE.GILJ01000776.1~~GILJ01000776.1.p1  ORF type:complete len:1719 (+),score=373.80 GILJ01000776.1:96-5252(+)